MRFFVVAVVLVCSFACARPQPVERYRVRGTVVSVDADAARVTVAHLDVPGYMPAMTMPFRVKDTQMLGALAPGRTITADLVVDGKSSWLENVVVTSTSGTQSLPSRVEGAVDPVPGSPAPAFSLTDQDGRRISLEGLRGKSVVVTFIYTRCPLPDYCPLMTDNFSEIRKLLDADRAVGPKVELVSISIDPEYDTPGVMRAYAAEHAGANGAVPEGWAFATGTPEEIRRVAESYGLVYQTENGQIVHSLRTAVIGPDGVLVKVFRGNEWKPAEVVAVVTQLETQSRSPQPQSRSR